MICKDCGNEHGVTVLRTIKIQREVIELKYNGGMCTMPDGRVLCWFCASPTVGKHL